MKNIAIVEGGYSHEKIISVKSAQTVMEHIDRSKFNPIRVSIDRDNWLAYDGDTQFNINKDTFSFVKENERVTFDMAFIVVHGTPGEDGKLQAYFDMIGMPYSTCNHLAATLTFNKFVCNQYLKNFEVNVAESVLIRSLEELNVDHIVKSVGLPCFVKPVDGGSSFGVTKVVASRDLNKAVADALVHGTEVIIESFMEGREVTNGVYRLASGEVKVLPITEIVSENDFFDFDAKYNGKSNEITPAILDEEMVNKVKETTKRIYNLLHLSGIARADYILKDNVPHLIEINTVPGLSEESIIPQMAKCAGIPLKELFSEIITATLG